MEKILVIDQQPNEVILYDGSRPRYVIRGNTVYHQNQPLWEIKHAGSSLFAGTWKILSLPDRVPLAGYRYIHSSFRYGEDLKLRHYGLDIEFLFRRVDPEKDRWLLISQSGENIMEAFPGSGSGALEFHLQGSCDEEPLWPLICLLLFDRLSYDRV
ncbi:MAG: hypothetical protein JXQ27_17190 [Acidobacteria bacterium]|nr:hypothetical protein [Acidobacteriota bacterium]